MRPEAHGEVFYNDLAPEDARAASKRLVDEALAPVATPVHTTPARHGSLPRAYVRTRRDTCLTPDLQGRMLAAAPCDPVVELDTGHSPFLSRPDELVAALLSLA